MDLPIKLCGIGLKYYFIDFFNSFDAFVSVTSLIDIIVSNIVIKLDLGGITALRTFRLLRLFKLAKTWK